MTSVPRTCTEWKAALAEIKRDYMGRRFRECSTRCREILLHTDELDQANPVYLVYLHFYAATALEVQALTIHHSSPSRAALLKQAYDHLSTASKLAKHADEDMSRPTSRFSSALSGLHSPGLHSPAGSDSSASTAFTTRSSTTASVCSVDEVALKPCPTPRPKKRVAFCDKPMVEPIIRPDSPTLGFDEWLGRSSPEPVYPESILKSVKPSLSVVVSAPLAPASPSLGDVEDVDPFFYTRSIHRFCTILSSIRRQITAHMTTLELEISACRIPTVPAHSNRELKALDVKARIERLRACGWKRTRFDAQRYERLTENALADMVG
ncbi:uncharacterized protein MAM_05837 [Metarhizium album ARSEF 1941]|uniref:Uncharacterized protein n=1 Tax=Metarhizium album (strain ARSEF 1941) TaxID=1081103 RepID=A0A0B2WJS1_METAS|nr:uncharacterized protein MAM_05837 [Metarhizium album ARSEF 1941]KHN96251.1 hypothetical protein MAM_05837 [Metarhizium album ARSEF 1941]